MTVQPRPELSIIIPTYNRLPRLKEAVESFHSKLTCTYEVIIVDDGSTDGTPDYLQLLTYPFRVFLRPHQGPQAARNVGMGAAIGQYLKFLDDDDLLEPAAVDLQISYMTNNPDIDVCYSDWGFVTYRSQQIHKRWLYIMNPIPDPVEYFVLDWWCAPFVYLFRRSVVENHHWDETPVLTDFIFVSDIILAGARFGYLPTAPVPLGWYRAIGDKQKRLSQSASNVVRAQCEVKILEKMESFLVQSGALTEGRKNAFAVRYFRIAKRVFPDDRQMFRQLVARLKQLAPQFEPDGKRYGLLIRWLGYERAEWLRRFSLKVRAKLPRVIRKAHVIQHVPKVPTTEIIPIHVDKHTIIPKT